MSHDTWNGLNMQHITPNSKRWDHSAIPFSGHKKIKGPAQMAEGGHHLRKAPYPHPLNHSKLYVILYTGPVFYLCLRTCLETVSAKTVLRRLRSLALSVFYLCLRQKIVLQIQIQVLVNTVAPIKYLIFLKISTIKRNFIFTKCILILGNYCCIIEHKVFFRLFVTQA